MEIMVLVSWKKSFERKELKSQHDDSRGWSYSSVIDYVLGIFKPWVQSSESKTKPKQNTCSRNTAVR
jgi:hypothetical protein